VADVAGILTDLAAESAVLESLVGDLPEPAWRTPTPAEGWTIGHQIAHLAWTDEAALLAATDPAAFDALLRRFAADPGAVDDAAAEGAAVPPGQLLDRWRRSRTELATTLAALPAGTRLPWFGPPMGAASMATARTMETWAHGQDVADALAVPHPAGAALRHVAHLGVRTRDFAYLVNGRTAPAAEFRVELTAPSGEVWTWGPADTVQTVRGPAVDFCLLVTRRRHRDDLALIADGTEASDWLDIAQAFAGPPGSGRLPTA
jgi:uncharacterized protein (TIGR03084 family)